MPTHAAVGVHDDLPARQAAVAMRTARQERARRVDEAQDVLRADLGHVSMWRDHHELAFNEIGAISH
jgi:hypothetical protein